MRSIDPAFFQMFPNAASIEVDADNTTYKSNNGLLLTAADNSLLLVPEGMEGAAVLPLTLASVPACVFTRCTKLTAIVFPNGSTGSDSFSIQDGILYTEDMSTLVAAPAGIGSSVSIAEDAEQIAEGAFYGNAELETIIANGNVDGIAANPDYDPAVLPADEAAAKVPAFNNDTIERATVALTGDFSRKAWEAAGFTRFAESAKPGDQIVPVSGSGFAFTLLDDYTLAVRWTGDDPAPAALSIPSYGTCDGVQYAVSAIAKGGFAGQTGIVTVDMPASLTTVGARAFDGCESLRTVHLASATETIGSRAFAGTALQSLVLPAGVRSIDDEALAGLNGTTVVALDAIADVSAQALAESSNVSVYAPSKSADVSAWSAGLPATGNHVYLYGVQMSDETVVLDQGQSANLFDAGMLEAPGDVQVTYAYKAKPLSISDDGTVTAKQAGSSSVGVTLTLTVEETVMNTPQREVVQLEPAAFGANAKGASTSGTGNGGMNAPSTVRNTLTLSQAAGMYSVNGVAPLADEGDPVPAVPLPDYQKYTKTAPAERDAAQELETVDTFGNTGAGSAYWYLEIKSENDVTLHIRSTVNTEIANSNFKWKDANGTTGTIWTYAVGRVYSGAWQPAASVVTKIDMDANVVPEGTAAGRGSMLGWFRAMPKLSTMEGIIIPSGVTVVAFLFFGSMKASATPLINIKLDLPDTVTNCGNMFQSASRIGSLDPSFKIPAKVTTTHLMFYDCANLSTIPDGFTLPDKVTTANWMFRGTAITAIPRGFTIKATGCQADGMFKECTKLASIAAGFTLPSKVDACMMFEGCTALTSIPSDFRLPSDVADISRLFWGCSNLKVIPRGFQLPSAPDSSGNCSFINGNDMFLNTTNNAADKAIADGKPATLYPFKNAAATTTYLLSYTATAASKGNLQKYFEAKPSGSTSTYAQLSNRTIQTSGYKAVTYMVPGTPDVVPLSTSKGNFPTSTFKAWNEWLTVVVEDGKLVNPGDPKSAYWAWDGKWYTNEACTTQFTSFDSAASAPATLYMKYNQQVSGKLHTTTLAGADSGDTHASWNITNGILNIMCDSGHEIANSNFWHLDDNNASTAAQDWSWARTRTYYGAWAPARSATKQVKMGANVAPQNTSKKTGSMLGWFRNMPSLSTFDGVIIPNGVTTIAHLFIGSCSSASVPLFKVKLDIPDTVINMSNAFQSLSRISGLDDSFRLPASVASVHLLFYGCSNFTYIPEGFNLPAKVTAANWMFRNTPITTIPKGFEILAPGCQADGMFKGCTKLTSISADFSLPSRVDACMMFEGCTALTALPSTFQIPKDATNIARMFWGCTNLKIFPATFDLPGAPDANGNCSFINGSNMNLDTVADADITPSNPAHLYPFYNAASTPTYLMGYTTTQANKGNLQKYFEAVPKVPSGNTKNYAALSNRTIQTGSYKAVTFMVPGTPDVVPTSGTTPTFTWREWVPELVDNGKLANPGDPVLDYWAWDGKWYTDMACTNQFTAFDSAASAPAKLYMGHSQTAGLLYTKTLAGADSGTRASWSLKDSVLYIECEAGHEIATKSFKTLRERTSAEVSNGTAAPSPATVDGWLWTDNYTKTFYGAWAPVRNSVTKIVTGNNVAPEGTSKNTGSMYAWFWYMPNLSTFSGINIPYGVKNISMLFFQSAKNDSVPLFEAELALPNTVTLCSHTFQEAKRISGLADSFKIPQGVTSTHLMFYNAVNLSKIPDGFTLPSTTTAANWMFRNSGITSIPRGFTISATGCQADGMFMGCTKLTSISAGFSLASQIDAVEMFEGCTALTTLPTGFTVPSDIKDMARMFWGCTNLKVFPASFNLPSAPAANGTCSFINGSDVFNNAAVKPTDQTTLYPFKNTAATDTYLLGYTSTASAKNNLQKYFEKVPTFISGNTKTLAALSNRTIKTNINDIGTDNVWVEFKIPTYTNNVLSWTSKYEDICSKNGFESPGSPNSFGYSFAGWYADSALTTKYNFAKPIAGQAKNASGTTTANTGKASEPYVIYARMNPMTATITFDANAGKYPGAKAGKTTRVGVTFDRTLPSLTATGWKPTLTGWTFQGYYDNANANGTTIGTQYYKANGTAAVSKWQHESSMTLYARFTENTYKFNFYKNENGSTATASTPSALYSKTVTAPSTVARKGWTFVGWTQNGSAYNTDAKMAALDPAKLPADVITDPSKFTISPKDLIAKDATLEGATAGINFYAVYTLDKHTITLNHGANDAAFDTNSAEYKALKNVVENATAGPKSEKGKVTTTGSTTTITYSVLTPQMSIPGLVRTGYPFDGWQKSGTSTKTPTVTVNPAGMTTLEDPTYAGQWGEANSYAISYKNDSSTGTAVSWPQGVTATATYKVTGPATLTLTEPAARKGYTFEGWSGPGITGTVKNPSAITLKNLSGYPKNLEYIAHWTQDSYEVTLDYNDGSYAASVKAGQTGNVPTVTNKKFSYQFDEAGTAQAIVLPLMERPGYAFDGWNAVVNGALAGKATTVDPTVSAEPLTFRAAWTPMANIDLPVTTTAGDTEYAKTNSVTFTLDGLTGTANTATATIRSGTPVASYLQLSSTSDATGTNALKDKLGGDATAGTYVDSLGFRWVPQSSSALVGSPQTIAFKADGGGNAINTNMRIAGSEGNAGATAVTGEALKRVFLDGTFELGTMDGASFSTLNMDTALRGRLLGGMSKTKLATVVWTVSLTPPTN